MKHKWYSFLCAALFIVALIVPAHAAGELTLSMGAVVGTAGNEVSVPIVVKNNPGIAMADLKVEYDSNALTFLSVENGTVFAQSELIESYASGSPYPILFVSTAGNHTGNGTLITLRFRVNADCAGGTYPLTFRSGSMVSDFNENVLHTLFVGGSVFVTDKVVENTTVHVSGQGSGAVTVEVADTNGALVQSKDGNGTVALDTLAQDASYVLKVSQEGCVARTVLITADTSSDIATVTLVKIGNLNGRTDSSGQETGADDMQCLFEYLSKNKMNSNLVPATGATENDIQYFKSVSDVNADGVTNILDYQALYEIVKTNT